MKKDRLMEVIQNLPQEFDLDELMEKLIFIDKIEKGLKQVDGGNTISHDELKATIRK